MFRFRIRKNSQLKCEQPYEGLTLAREIEKFQEEGGEIEMGSPLIFTKKSDGVRPETNIRTDRFEMAQDRMQIANEAKNAQRAKKKADEEAKNQPGINSALETPKTNENEPETGSGNPE